MHGDRHAKRGSRAGDHWIAEHGQGGERRDRDELGERVGELEDELQRQTEWRILVLWLWEAS